MTDNKFFYAWELWEIYNNSVEADKKLKISTQIWIFAIMRILSRYYKNQRLNKDMVKHIAKLDKDYLSQQGEEINKILEEHLIQVYKEVYKKANLHLGNIHFIMPSDKELKKLVSSVWVGKYDFKQRVFRNLKQINSKLVDILEQELEQEELKLALEKLQKNYYYRLHRLFRTETMHIIYISTMRAYAENGVNYVKWVTTMDEKTCPICSGRDLRVYPISLTPKYPDHPFCRCVLVPYNPNFKMIKKGTGRAKRRNVPL